MAAEVAAAPSGRMTRVFQSLAALEAAGRFIRSEEVDDEAIRASMRRATAHRCQGHRWVWVPVDQSALTLADPQGRKDLGHVGTTKTPARGLQVMTAIGVTPDGVPQGLLGQSLWARENRKKKQSTERDTLATEDKETQQWLDVMALADGAMAEFSFGTVPWFQLDRGADAWPILFSIRQSRGYLTVRAAWDRRVLDEEAATQQYLWDRVGKRPVLGDYLLPVVGGPARKERSARMVLRACPVTLDLRDKRTGRRFCLEINAVLAREEGTTPRAERPIEWLLLTTYPVDGIEAAHAVVFGYSQRWRIEEFHRAWKAGGCCVEETQLHQRAHVERWATLLAAVAMRLVRLAYLARHHADTSATIELTPAEIEAARLARNIKKRIDSGPPTIGQAVLWIAQEGGYTGKSSGGPPGHAVIARGLQRIATLARVLSRPVSDDKGEM
jgi:hypothetical protein